MSIKRKFNRKKNAAANAKKSLLNANEEINRGLKLMRIGNFTEAELIFKRVSNIFPKNEDSLVNMGIINGEKGDIDRAIKLFQKTLSLNPGNVTALYNLGFSFRTKGLIEEARDIFEKALTIKPDYALCHFMVSSLKKYTYDDKHIAEMEKVFAGQNIDDKQRSYLAFSLGKAYEDCAMYEKAFSYLEIANKLNRNSIHYPKEETTAEFNLIKKTFNKSFISDFPDIGHQDETPIFVVGMPRSGSSLVEQILASHREVYGAGEVDYLNQTITQCCGSTSIAKICEYISTDNGEILRELGPSYMEKLRKHSHRSKFIIDKFLYNFLWIGVICLALPNAKIIYCSRNSMDTGLSIYKNRLLGGHPFSCDLREIGHYLLLHNDLMRYWHKVFPNRIYEISYEKLINNQEMETGSLLEHCNLAWDESCISFHRTLRNVKTASVTQVRKPIYKDSEQLWKRYEKQLQPLREILNDDKTK